MFDGRSTSRIEENNSSVDGLTRVQWLTSQRTGASRVLIFDHKTRHGPTNWHSLGPGNQAIRGPILRAHVDQSYRGAEFDLRWYLPDEADVLLGRRWQIINVC